MSAHRFGGKKCAKNFGGRGSGKRRRRQPGGAKKILCFVTVVRRKLSIK